MAKNTKVALVTGAGSGIGKASALALLKEGYSVVFAGRRKEALDAAIKEGRGGKRALAVPANVTDPASVKALFAATKKAFGRLDVLFNNAGSVIGRLPIKQLVVVDWDPVIAVIRAMRRCEYSVTSPRTKIRTTAFAAIHCIPAHRWWHVAPLLAQSRCAQGTVEALASGALVQDGQ